MLTTFIEEVLNEEGIRPADLDAVAVSMGPGSYTGLRIGVASAKGLCYAIERPLIAVPTLEAMALGMEVQMTNDKLQTQENKHDILFCPMIDARRMEVYSALYDASLKEVRPVAAEIIDDLSFSGYFANHRIVFGGEGAAKCLPLLGGQPNALFLENFSASARFLVPLAQERFLRSRFEDLAYFEPFYLKDFVAGKPRVKGLH